MDLSFNPPLNTPYDLDSDNEVKIVIKIEFKLVKPMAVKIWYRKKKSYTLDSLFIEQKSTDFQILPFDNHLSGSLITNLRLVLT